MTEKPRVAIVRATKYDIAALQPAIQQSLELIGGLPPSVRPGAKVFVKINHLPPPSPPDRGIITHPVFTAAVLEILKATGADITVGDDIEEDGGDGFAVSGYREVCARLGVKLVNLRETGFIPVKTVGRILPEIYLARAVKEADVIINLPKLKTHSLTLFTGGIKNLYGVIPAGMRRRFHGDYARPEDFCQMLVDIFTAATPQITLMDGIMAMEGEGPGSGTMRPLGVILTSRDTVALDAVAARLIGIPPREEVLTTAFAAARGLGTGDLNQIEVVGEKISNLAARDFRLPAAVSRKVLRSVPGPLVKFSVRQISPRPVVKRKNCTACRACEKACPAGAIKVNDKNAEIEYTKCVRCMCCHEVCRYQAITPRRPFLGHLVYGAIRGVQKIIGK